MRPRVPWQSQPRFPRGSGLVADNAASRPPPLPISAPPVPDGLGPRGRQDGVSHLFSHALFSFRFDAVLSGGRSRARAPEPHFLAVKQQSAAPGRAGGAAGQATRCCCCAPRDGSPGAGRSWGCVPWLEMPQQMGCPKVLAPFLCPGAEPSLSRALPAPLCPPGPRLSPDGAEPRGSVPALDPRAQTPPELLVACMMCLWCSENVLVVLVVLSQRARLAPPLPMLGPHGQLLSPAGQLLSTHPSWSRTLRGSPPHLSIPDGAPHSPWLPPTSRGDAVPFPAGCVARAQPGDGRTAPAGAGGRAGGSGHPPLLRAASRGLGEACVSL